MKKYLNLDTANPNCLLQGERVLFASAIKSVSFITRKKNYDL